MQLKKSKDRPGYLYVIITVILVLIVYITVEYSELFNSQYDTTKNNLLQQVRICGLNINTSLYEFEDQTAYFANSFKNLNLSEAFLKGNGEYISGLRKYYFNHQHLINSISIYSENSKIEFRKYPNNYFEWGKSQKLFNNFKLRKKQAYKILDGKYTFIVPVNDDKGIIRFNYAIELNLERFVESEFANYFVGENSWKILIDKNKNLLNTQYSEMAANKEVLSISKIDEIAAKISEGYEGIIYHSLLTNKKEYKLLSAYYPINLFNNEFGILFSFDADKYIYATQNTSLRIVFSFSAIILLVTLIFFMGNRSRKQLLQQHKESEERQRMLLNSYPDVTVFQDNTGKYIDIYHGNRAEKEIYESTFKGRTHFEVFPTEVAANIENKIKETHEKGKIALFDYFDKVNSQYYELRFAPLPGKNTLTIIRNVTSKKRTEERLKYSHERFLTVLNSIDAFIYVADFNTYEILFINNAGKKAFGDVQGKTCWQNLQTGQTGPCEFCTNDQLIKNRVITDEPVIWEFINTTNNRWYRIFDRAIPWVDGRLVRFEMAVDITDLKEAQVRLSQEEEKFRGIFETFLDVYYRTDISGNVEIISPSAQNLFGWKPEDIIGENVTILYKNPSDREKFIRQLYKDKAVNDFEIQLKRKDGSPISASVNSRLIFDNSNNPVRVEGSIRDISDRKRNELELRDAKDAALVADKTKSRFLANMSHELRTPLNGILGYTQVLLSDKDMDEKYVDAISIIQKSGEHLLNLINDILDISKIETDKIELELSSVNIHALLENITKIIGMKAESQGLIFKSKISSIPHKFLLLDERKVNQILFNLLNNSIKFTEKGFIELLVECEEGHLSIEVSDTGIGIPENKFDEIFSPFKQLSDHVNKADGTGLGLAISQSLVNLMGGNLMVKSTVGKGSKFYFSIPVKEDPIKQEEIPPKEKIVGYHETERKILVADDVKTNRMVIKRMLQPLGFEIIEAENGAAAVEQAIKNKVNLLLLDQKMPQLNGAEAIREIKTKMNIPGIIVSASSRYDEYTFDDVELVDDFILKPVKKDELLTKIKKHLNINWKHEKTEQQIEEKAPSNNELKFLLGYIANRNFSRFHQHLNTILQENNEYNNFVGKLRTMANQFETKKIKEYLEYRMDK